MEPVYGAFRENKGPEPGGSEVGAWAEIWDQSALQTLIARFDSSSARSLSVRDMVPNWFRKPA